MPKLPTDIERRLDDLGRNDPDEAEDIARACIFAIGYCPASVMNYLVMLQDDMAAFVARTKGLEVRPAPGQSEVR